MFSRIAGSLLVASVCFVGCASPTDDGDDEPTLVTTSQAASFMSVSSAPATSKVYANPRAGGVSWRTWSGPTTDSYARSGSYIVIVAAEGQPPFVINDTAEAIVRDTYGLRRYHGRVVGLLAGGAARILLVGTCPSPTSCNR